jgi:hypothetical protein
MPPQAVANALPLYPRVGPSGPHLRRVRGARGAGAAVLTSTRHAARTKSALQLLLRCRLFSENLQ